MNLPICVYILKLCKGETCNMELYDNNNLNETAYFVNTDTSLCSEIPFPYGIKFIN